MGCMKKPFSTEQQAVANRDRMNRRKGTGPTFQVAYPCPDCMEDDGPTTWHLRTERPIEGRIARVVQLRRGPRRHRPAARPWQDEDYEGKWVA